MTKVFIDGREGTTGLRIDERLSGRDDIELITLEERFRKDDAHRKEALNACDIAFLCLPDAAAVSAVSMIENPNVRVIDASTAHRTAEGWVYGLPELSEKQRAAVAAGNRVAVPGCHASGFVTLVYPLIKAGLLPADAQLCCHCLTGYSGGGKKMIAAYEAPDRDALLDAPRQYGITQQHKHLKEMQGICGLQYAPLFTPIVGDFYSGMLMTVQLFQSQLAPGAGIEQIRSLYAERYQTPIVQYTEVMDKDGFFSAAARKNQDSMLVSVAGNAERILLLALYDNLGKGASGAAIECMNLMTGNNPEKGLVL